MNEAGRPPRRGRGNPAPTPPDVNRARTIRTRSTGGERRALRRAPRRAPASAPHAPARRGTCRVPPSFESAKRRGTPHLLPFHRRPAGVPAARPDGTFAPANGARESARVPGAAERRRGRRNRGRGRREPGSAQYRASVRSRGSWHRSRWCRRRDDGLVDPARDGGFIRRARAAILADDGDAYVPPSWFRQYSLRKSDLVAGSTGRDPRGRTALYRGRAINGDDPATALRRPSSTPSRRPTPNASCTWKQDAPRRVDPS